MLCMIAKLDGEATEKLRALQRAARGEDLPGRPLYGHVTLASYTGAEEERFLRFGRELAEGRPAFSLVYRQLLVLEETSILVAAPERAEALEELHRRAAAAWKDDLDPWTRGDRWFPHTTLFYGPEADLQGICRRMAASFVPFPARVCGIEFSRVRESGYEIVESIRLDTQRL